MGNCAKCGKRTNFWKKVGDFSGNEFCSKSCKTKFHKEKKENKKKEKEFLNDGKVHEYKRTCNNCGKVWYSLVAREKEIESSMKTDTCMGGLAACSCSPIGLILTNQHRQKIDGGKGSLDNLRKCPECQSTDYKEEIVSHEKKH